MFTKLPWFGWKKFRLSFESGCILLSAVLLLPVACGLSGLIGYLSTPALKTGMGWRWHVVICAAMLIVAIAGFAAWWMENRNEAR